MAAVVEAEEFAGEPVGLHRHGVVQIRIGFPDDVFALGAGVFDEAARNDVTLDVRIAAGDQPRHAAHPGARRVEHSSGMGDPRPGHRRFPRGKEVRALRTAGKAVKQQFGGADPVLGFQHRKRLQQRGAGPLLGFPVVVILESGCDDEDFIPVGPFGPSGSALRFAGAGGVAPAEIDQNPVLQPVGGAVGAGDAAVKRDLRILRSLGFHDDLFDLRRRRRRSRRRKQQHPQNTQPGHTPFPHSRNPHHPLSFPVSGPP